MKVRYDDTDYKDARIEALMNRVKDLEKENIDLKMLIINRKIK